MPTGQRAARGARQAAPPAPPPAAAEPAVDDWQARFERSEAARQKLRETLLLLREKAVNTEALLRRHAEDQAKVTAAESAKSKAEAAASRAKKAGDALQRRVNDLEGQMTGLQAQMAAVLHHLTGGGAAPSLQLPPPPRPAADELAQLRATVERHEREIGVWNSVLKPYMEKGGQKRGGAAAAAAAAARAPPPTTADPVRARAIEARRKAAAMPPKPSIPEFLGPKKGAAAPAPAAAPQEEERPTKRVRLSEPLDHQPADSEYEGPPPPTDVAVTALKAVSGGDNTAPSAEAVAEAVRLLGPGSEFYGQANQRGMVIAALAVAVLECAAFTPARRLATPALSPSLWFNNDDAQPAEDDADSPKPLPSFVGVWCKTGALERHALRWLLHCAAELSKPVPQKGKKTAKASKKDENDLCEALARELATGVVKDVATGRPMYTPTERCASGAVAAALWRLRGDAKALQAFLVDLLLAARPGGEAETVAPAAAAVEAWPEAVPTKGALGAPFMEALRAACAAGAGAGASAEARAAARWLRRLGVMRWGWAEEDDEEDGAEGERPGGAVGSRAAAAARRKLQKFAA